MGHSIYIYIVVYRDSRVGVHTEGPMVSIFDNQKQKISSGAALKQAFGRQATGILVQSHTWRGWVRPYVGP